MIPITADNKINGAIAKRAVPVKKYYVFILMPHKELPILFRFPATFHAERRILLTLSLVILQDQVKIEQITHGDAQLAIILRKDFNKEGIEFLTTDEDPLQLGYMNRPKEYVIRPHTHNPVERTITHTHEVLFIKSGKVRVDFYTQEKSYIRSVVVREGDTILLADGGHGFKMLEDSEIVEVKQGPYVGDMDKQRFDPIDDERVIV